MATIYPMAQATLHFDDPSTVESLTARLDAVELAYNCFTWPFSQSLSWNPWEKRFGIYPIYGFEPVSGGTLWRLKSMKPGDANIELRGLINDDALMLEVSSITETESLDVIFRGFHKSLEWLIRSLDPQYRREHQARLQREADEHEIRMRAARREQDKADLMALLDLHDEFVRRELITPEDSRVALKEVLINQKAAVLKLADMGVESRPNSLVAIDGRTPRPVNLEGVEAS